MLIVALTGGIGSGKTTVAQFFSELGAVVVDADQLARRVVAPKSSGFDEVVERFGVDILKNGDIDRKKLASVVFTDERARKDLEAIVHPRVQKLFSEIVSSLDETQILVYEIPLLAETASEGKFDYIITVEADLDTRRVRLLHRGMLAEEIERRIASQSSQEDREAIADAILLNNGDEDQLLRQVENLWEGALADLLSGKKRRK